VLLRVKKEAGTTRGERKKGYQQVQQEKDGKTKERLLLINASDETRGGGRDGLLRRAVCD
jgi:hypothetical protein